MLKEQIFTRNPQRPRKASETLGVTGQIILKAPTRWRNL